MWLPLIYMHSKKLKRDRNRNITFKFSISTELSNLYYKFIQFFLKQGIRYWNYEYFCKNIQPIIFPHFVSFECWNFVFTCVSLAAGQNGQGLCKGGERKEAEGCQEDASLNHGEVTSGSTTWDSPHPRSPMPRFQASRDQSASGRRLALCGAHLWRTSRWDDLFYARTQ